MNLDKAAGISTATRDDKGKDDESVEKQRRDSGKTDDASASERIKQRRRAIERQLREKEEEEERRKKEAEDKAKKAAEAEQEKHSKEITEKVRLEFPATGKIRKMTWAKQQQRLQEKIKQRQEEAKEREAGQCSFGKVPPTFQIGPQTGPRIDATFFKKLREEKKRNKIQDQTSGTANLDTLGIVLCQLLLKKFPYQKMRLRLLINHRKSPRWKLKEKKI